MHIRSSLILLGSLVLAACSSEPTIQTGPDAEIILGTLHRIDNTRAGIAYVDPNVDFSKYTRVLLDPLGVDNVEIIQPGRSITNRGNKDWELTEADKTKLRDAFRQSMVRELQEKGDYPIVDEVADDVLRITVALTSIAPTASKDDNKSRAIGRTRVYTEGGGSIAIAVGFSDSQTGEVLAVVKDRKRGSSMWGSNNSVSNMGDVKFMFSSWARAIRARLDIIHE